MDYINCNSFAIMGGTFDPIHYGHLASAESVRHEFGVEKVLFVPSGRPPHKDNTKVTNDEDRLNMTVIATESNPNFMVSKIEIERPGRTYTIDTIKEIRKMCIEDTRIYFITGADALHDLITWKSYEKLLMMCEFIAISRPGYEKRDLFKDIEELEDNKASYETRIHYLEVPALDISSSEIRERVRNARPIKYLLPERVEEYIIKNSLYK